MICVSVLALCLACFGCSSANGSADQGNAAPDGQQSTDQPVEQAPDYSTGTHHARLVFDGYEDTPVEFEIYSDTAPVTASTFCELVEQGYYDGKTLFWILDDMYVRIGSTVQDDNHLITGEYEESDVSNPNSLKTGVVALNRAEDGQQSDAGSFIVFLSDMSYLDGKYAAFGKVIKGMDVINKIADLTESDNEKTRIETNKSGKIKDKKDCPVITSIRMVD